jgi:hypothetical protein
LREQLGTAGRRQGFSQPTWPSSGCGRHTSRQTGRVSFSSKTSLGWSSGRSRAGPATGQARWGTSSSGPMPAGPVVVWEEILARLPAGDFDDFLDKPVVRIFFELIGTLGADFDLFTGMSRAACECARSLRTTCNRACRTSTTLSFQRRAGQPSPKLLRGKYRHLAPAGGRTSPSSIPAKNTWTIKWTPP